MFKSRLHGLYRLCEKGHHRFRTKKLMRTHKKIAFELWSSFVTAQGLIRFGSRRRFWDKTMLIENGWIYQRWFQDDDDQPRIIVDGLVAAAESYGGQQRADTPVTWRKSSTIQRPPFHRSRDCSSYSISLPYLWMLLKTIAHKYDPTVGWSSYYNLWCFFRFNSWKSLRSLSLNSSFTIHLRCYYYHFQPLNAQVLFSVDFISFDYSAHFWEFSCFIYDVIFPLFHWFLV